MGKRYLTTAWIPHALSEEGKLKRVQVCQKLLSDFYLFSPMKSALKGKKFQCADDVQMEIEAWLNSKSQQFFEAGIKKLPGRWQRCIDHGGDYFQRLNVDDE